MRFASIALSMFITLVVALPASAAYVGEISSVGDGTYSDQWRTVTSFSSAIMDDTLGGRGLTYNEFIDITFATTGTGSSCTIAMGDSEVTETIYAGDVHLIAELWYVGVVEVEEVVVNETARCRWAYDFTDLSFEGNSPGDDSSTDTSATGPGDNAGSPGGQGCEETDDGFDTQEQGTNTGTWLGNGYTAVDYCMQDPDKLFEYVCLGGSNSGSIITCAGGCVDGACVTPPAVNGCSETDGGIDAFNEGVNTGFFNGNAYEAADYCLSGDSKLLEYSCNGTRNDDSIIECDNGCIQTGDAARCAYSWEEDGSSWWSSMVTIVASPFIWLGWFN